MTWAPPWGGLQTTITLFTLTMAGLSRSVSNLGSSLGTAFAGSILVAADKPGGRPFALTLVTLLVIALIGLVLAVFIPRRARQAAHPPD